MDRRDPKRRAEAEARLRTATQDQDTAAHPSRDEITRLAHSISDRAAAIHQADPRDKAEFYHRLGLQLTYTPGTRTVRAEITPDPHPGPGTKRTRNDKSPRLHGSRGDLVRVRGGSWTNGPRIAPITALLTLDSP
jgi:hypothetical protein